MLQWVQKHKWATVISVIVVMFLLGVSLLALYINTHRRESFKLFLSLVYDNNMHLLPCDQLPSIEEVDRVVQEHRDVAERIIKEVAPYYRDGEIEVFSRDGSIRDGEGFYVEFRWGPPMGCRDNARGEITISYMSHRDRVIIERIIGGDTFFGIPYNLINF